MLLNLFLTLLMLHPLSSVYFSDKLFFDIEASNQMVAPQRINLENIGVKVKAQRYAVIDLASGKLLAQKEINVPQPLASITKLMTALVILDQKPDWPKIVEMQPADETQGAFPHIYRGEQARFFDLWKAGLITSDNNAIMAMTRALGFSEEDFVKLMNAKAQAWRLYDTQFADPTGLSEENFSTALDVARLVYQALKKNEIRETVLQSQYEFTILNTKRHRKIYNTDILVDSFLNQAAYGYEWLGGKTGFLPGAGYCLAAAVKKAGQTVLIVVLNSPSVEDRFQDVKVLADWVYSNYQWSK